CDPINRKIVMRIFTKLIISTLSILSTQCALNAQNTKVKPKFKQTVKVENETVVLSERELEIVTLVAQGKSNAEIAEALFISPHTVKTHRKNINFKLNIHNPAELIHFAKEHHLIS
ncbi:MAG: response regulator transcription factor, partial [Bacteroidia bacterium]|nr:response regulator transcription factor [Bacteroidia bacterium]